MTAPTNILDVNAGPLADVLATWADSVLSPYLKRNPTNIYKEPKVIHDPVGKTIILLPWEVFIMDSPLVQRLRFIRQLGVGHYLFPSAGYTRFEHSIGCIQAASMLFDSISNPANSPAVTYVGDENGSRRDIVRLAALLHDTGHSILSHVSERFYESFAPLKTAQETLKAFYRSPVAPAEVVAILIIRSAAFQSLLAASGMRRTVFNDREIIDKLCACIAGSKLRTQPDSYLSEIINGPVDSDKIDYLARDGHMVGVPISLDLERLRSKLRLVRTTNLKGAPVYSLAIVPSGARALEEMLVSRIFLYDKFYYHPKIMAAEELVRRALHFLSKAHPNLQSPSELLNYGDDEFLSMTPSVFIQRYGLYKETKDVTKGCELLRQARARELPKRAFAFAQRFMPEAPEAYSRFVNNGKPDPIRLSVEAWTTTDKFI
ncbi:MAG TPA: HD domain-containing protein, partial [Gemmatimonadaceae bacterium]|nr:HD domain-containing protein [Gemmatimonadaceae bacterium]